VGSNPTASIDGSVSKEKGMARVKMKAKDVQRLVAERDKLLDQIEALKHRIGGLELAISLLERDDDEQPSQPRGARGKTKELVLSLLKDAGTSGLNALSAVQMAELRNATLARGSAASTLSRLKADGAVAYDGDRYRLMEFTRPKVAVVQSTTTDVFERLKAAGAKTSQG
jgi:hypothetical protein